MVDYRKIYQTEAVAYDRLVSREDREANLLVAIELICPLEGAQVIELGAGTGRITRLLAPRVAEIVALDISTHMLEIAQKNLIADNQAQDGSQTVHLIGADNRRLPLKAAAANLAIAGWSLGHFVGWYKQEWRLQINLAISEMRRVTKPGGSLVIIETLGTGSKVPEPPNTALADYYDWLERDHGFTRSWIRTDYQFHSTSEAVELTRFFFGADLAKRLKESDSNLLPECTGLWYLTTPE